MAGNTKRTEIGGFWRHVLAENVAALMERKFRESSNKPRAIADATKMSLSSVQRILAAKVGTSIDNVELLADLFDVAPYHLLLPGLDPDNPQVINGASAAEKRLYAKMRRASLGHPAET